MKPFRSFILAIFFLLQLMQVKSQQPIFNAGIIAGLNFSELEGTGVTDYFGLNAGLIGTAKIAKHAQLGVEFLFSQNGEYIRPSYYPAIEYGKVRLNYIEVPVHFDWLISTTRKEKTYYWNVNLGVA